MVKKDSFPVGCKARVNFSEYKNDSPAFYAYWHGRIVTITGYGTEINIVSVDIPSFISGTAYLHTTDLESINNQLMLFEV